MAFDTSETRESVNCAAGAVCDALRYLGDVSYAVFPREIAHSLGDFKKSFLNVVRTVVDKEIDWIDERVVVRKYLVALGGHCCFHWCSYAR